MSGGADTYLAARLEEWAKRAKHRAIPVFTKFLDPAQAELALGAARRQGAQVRLWGGYEDAERRIAAFFALDEPEVPLEWPLCWLRFRWDSRYAAPGHRDLLGAMLGQGVERDNLGDLLVSEGAAYCAALPDIASYLTASLEEAGRATIRCDVPQGDPALPQPRLESRHHTVASLRLDAVLAVAWNLSRGEAADMIAQGRVRVDHLPQERTDARLGQGALVSVRGKGRFRLTEIGGLTKKGRMGIVLSHHR
ncbi:MAG: YlmH/Sll1252 family protein [Clostridia bacterium]|nr:YlmH/Sll1252 family protein [Clostridia bacterium]